LIRESGRINLSLAEGHVVIISACRQTILLRFISAMAFSPELQAAIEKYLDWEKVISGSHTFK
jgi:hypothetical protein